MNFRQKRYLIFVVVGITIFSSLLLAGKEADKADSNNMKLWYNAPAKEWIEALPVGNGRLGGMVFGGVQREHIQFNEDSLWTGIPRDYSHAKASEYLSDIRRLLLEGKQREAEELAMRQFMSIPLRQERYQPFGDIWIEFDGPPGFRDYRRELDLDKAVASVEYKKRHVTFARSVYVSYPDQVMVIHLTSDKAKQLNFALSLTSPHPKSQIMARADTIVLRGRVSDYLDRRKKAFRPSILKFESRLWIIRS